ncbi:MAG: hypothetical protein AAFQ52_15925 [Chloroflexota bacterium]
MSKTEQIHKIALDAGLPEDITVTYHRGARRWYIEHPIPLGTSARIGNSSTIIADYASIEEAQAQLPDVAEQFWTSYQRVFRFLASDLSGLTADEYKLLHTLSKARSSSVPKGSYRQLYSEGIINASVQLSSDWLKITLTPLGERILEANPALRETATAQESHDNIYKRDASTQDTLTTLLAEAENELAHLKQDATPTQSPHVQRLEQLLASIRDTLPPLYAQTNQYKPKEDYDHQPDKIDKLAWQQPLHRDAPVWVFALDCPYCGQHVMLERHSPREPQHCGDESCATEHKRILARERKRRQRRRENTSR